MKCFSLSAILLCIAAIVPHPAAAFVDDPQVVPTHPTTNKPIWVHVHMGWCHSSLDAVDGAELEVVGPGQLRLITDGVALDPGHPFCNDPPFNYRFNIGTLPAGSYILQFFIRDDISGAGLVGFGSVNFTVTPPARVPATSDIALVALSTALSIAGAVGWRRNARK